MARSYVQVEKIKNGWRIEGKYARWRVGRGRWREGRGELGREERGERDKVLCVST